MGYEVPADREALAQYEENFKLNDQYNIGSVLLGNLKRAMIDAFIVEKAFGGMFGHGKDHFSVNGDYYKLKIPYSETGDECWVVRPGPDGRGGGAHHPQHDAYGIPDYTGHFSDIRRQLNDLVKIWKHLPDPEELKELAEVFEDVSKNLRRDGGTLSGYVHELDTETSNPALAGSTIGAFRNMYVIHSPTVLNGLSGIAAVLASHFQAQQGLWTGARVGVVQIIKEYTTVFENLSHRKSVRGKVVLRALQYASTAAGAGSLKGALSLAVATLELTGIGDGEPSTPVEKSPGSFSEAVAALQASLSALNDDVFEAEKKIRDTAAENILRISSAGGTDARGNYHQNNRENYDLQFCDRDIQDVADFRIANLNGIGMDGDVIAHIVAEGGPMHAIAYKLHDLLRSTTTCHEDIAKYVLRHPAVGVGAYGPSEILQELNEVLCDLMSDLKWEVEQGARHLWSAYQVHVNANAQTAAELSGLNQALLDGSNYDPWDAQVRTTTLERRSRWNMLNISYYDEFMNPSRDEVDEEPGDYDWQPFSR